jgi:hypothetical protein
MQRLKAMARQWQQEVRPRHQLIRWMLRPEDHRMYEGFCRLEASQHGSLNNLFVFFYTPFRETESYSHTIMANWLQEHDENIEQKKLLAAAGVKGEWDTKIFKEAVAATDYAACNHLLPKMIDSYRQWLQMPQTSFVLALLPKEMPSPPAFTAWLETWMQQHLPDGAQLLLFDHVQGNFWGAVFEKYAGQSCTMQHDLRMEQAIREIATTGAATDPQASFRQCLFEMGEASTKKDRQRLQEWGEKALALGRKSGDALLLATAYISYAGMLFNFKAHEKIDTLLEEGLQVCIKGIGKGEESMKSLLLQYYAYKGSHCQIRKQRKEALGWFMRMGEEAAAFGFFTQSISAWYKTFIFARYKNFDTEKDKAVLSAMQLTDKLGPEDILSSEYPFLAAAFLQDRLDKWAGLRQQVEDKMQQACGPGWREGVEEMEKNYTRQRVREVEQQALMEE